MSWTDPKSSSSQYLLVYVPSMTGRPAPDGNTNYDRLLARVTSDPELEGWDVRVFDHQIKWWSTVSMEDAALRLAVAIRGWAGENQDTPGPRRIVLMGHSIGGLLVRAAFLRDAAQGTATDRVSHEHEWTKIVERIVLAAPPNAGFRQAQLPVPWYLTPVYRAVRAFRSFTAEQIEAGADWITGLRMRWFEYCYTSAHTEQAPPAVIQLLGDHDDLLLREDVLDVRYLLNSSHIDVAGATHGNLVDLREAADPEARYDLLKKVLQGRATNVEFGGAEPRSTARVFFLLHGIRSQRYGGWVGALADELSSAGPDEGTIAQASVSLEKVPSMTKPHEQPQLIVKSPSYGYFNAMQFVSPFARRRQVHRFLDWYADLYTSYDPSNMYFAGHSNGTYMLGYALENVREVRFKRVYLASSVLPRAFPWSSIVKRRQIGARVAGVWDVGIVHSDRATKDVPVGWLVSALNGLGMTDIGTGGFDGFDESIAALQEHKGAFLGGHGAPFAPGAEHTSPSRSTRKANDRRRSRRRIRQIAAFLLEQSDPSESEPQGVTPAWFSAVARASGVFSGPILAVLAITTAVALSRGNRRRRKYWAAALATVAWLIARSV